MHLPMNNDREKRAKAEKKLRLLKKINRVFLGLGVLFLLYVIYLYIVYFYTLYQMR